MLTIDKIHDIICQALKNNNIEYDTQGVEIDPTIFIDLNENETISIGFMNCEK